MLILIVLVTVVRPEGFKMARHMQSQRNIAQSFCLPTALSEPTKMRAIKIGHTTSVSTAAAPFHGGTAMYFSRHTHGIQTFAPDSTFPSTAEPNYKKHIEETEISSLYPLFDISGHKICIQMITGNEYWFVTATILLKPGSL